MTARALATTLAFAAGCAGGGWSRPGNVVDARVLIRPRRAVTAPETATAIYRGLLAPTWGTHCRMLPTDSVYFDRQVARCGAIPGAVAGIARLLLEVEATPEVLMPVPATDRVHWLESAAERRMLVVMLAAGVLSLPPAVGAAPCASDRVAADLGSLLDGNRFADAHQTALVAMVTCPEDRARWLLADAVALTLLDDLPRAQELAGAVAREAPAPLAGRAEVLRGWMAWRSGDRGALAQIAPRLAPPARARLCLLARADDLGVPGDPCAGAAPAALEARTAEIITRYRAAHVTRRPWLAATLSALLPGAGQAYGGSWQGAAVALVLNAATIGATVDLARHGLYFASGLTGLAASVVYVGNIVNAADLARRRNEQASEAPRQELERLLVPERFMPAAP